MEINRTSIDVDAAALQRMETRLIKLDLSFNFMLHCNLHCG